MRSLRPSSPSACARLCAPLALIVAAAAAARADDGARGPDPYADAPPYLRAVAPNVVSIRPLITTGERVPLAGGGRDERFRLIGVPDGLGLRFPGGARFVLLVNHEISQSSGGPAGPLPGGARISAFLLAERRRAGARRLEVLSGKPAIEALFLGEPPTLVPPGARRLTKLCSAFFAGPEVGFDRPIFLNGEEEPSWEKPTCDEGGPSGFATIDGAAYQLPRVGRAPWENLVVANGTGARTAIFALDDGPESGSGLHSQLYLYVGTKEPRARHPLSRNGLDNGTLHVLVSADPARPSEETFMAKGTSLPARWVPVDWRLSARDLEAASRRAGSFLFVRLEDGATDPKKPGVLYFTTTGDPDAPFNAHGRLYRLDFDPEDPTGPARLTILLDGSEGIVNPDNIDVNRHGEIAICEDPQFEDPADGPGRDAALWIYGIADGRLARVAEVDREAAKRHALAADPRNAVVAEKDLPGRWELSGVVDAETALGRGAWVLDVQAHGLRIAPQDETVEGGQILQLIVKEVR
jgi:hypothetical protein